MKIALLGHGKTGSKVVELLQDNPPTIFNTANPPTFENLKGHDGVISFLPGKAFKNYIPLLVESKLPVVTGSTGFDWPEDFDLALSQRNLTWIHGNNFALGMNLVYQMIKVLSNTPSLFSSYTFDLHEVHHTKKMDAPSGTAKAWEKWLERPVSITSERTGDVIGDHCLTLNTPHEAITLRHEAKDRKIFADGALWAMSKILKDKTLKPGLHNFEDLARKELQ